MATNETNKLIFGTTTYNLKDDSGTASSHTHTKSQITDFPTSMTPASHTHGNIQNNGTLQTTDVTVANGDKLVVTDASSTIANQIVRSSISFDGSTATKCLTQKGTWETFGTSNLAIGTTGTTACAGNDSRLSDNRFPSNNSSLVHTSGDESISGTKSFMTMKASNGYINDLYSYDNSYDYTIQLRTSLDLSLGHDILVTNSDSNIAMRVSKFSSSTAYSVGQYTVYQGMLYKCTTAHSAAAWNSDHFTRCVNQIVSTDNVIAKTFEATGSDYAEKFETLEDCPVCRFVTLDGEKIKLAQPEDDYILGITSETPSIVGDKENQGTPVGMLGKLWVEHDGSAKVNGYVISGKDGIATNADKGYRVMAVDGNRCKVLVK